MNTEAFTGRAYAYVKARPGYPDEAMEYIYKLAPMGAVFADIGAGTGKFTELLALYGNEIFAVEPNADMRGQLVIALSHFPNTKIFDGTAEATKLPDNSVDVITCAQALNKFDLDMFRMECQRIGKSNPIVVSLYNQTPGKNESASRYNKSTGSFYRNPEVRVFSNPVYFTRDNWLLYHTSMSGVPMESDAGYEKYTAELNAIFERDSVNGFLRLDFTTKVYSEQIG
ncbi:MAG: class I SAM-dependent methyltransferase [Oscillospiraceae bacterium]|nr:class I SAM-dependent methyltransferase [Oscillospiraceae bacterium]